MMNRTACAGVLTVRAALVSMLSVACLVLCVLLGACETETTIKNYHPMLGGLPNAESGIPVSAPAGAAADPTKMPENSLETTDERGVKHLRAMTARHVMVHIANTLAKNEGDVFTREVLSERTANEYYARGLQPTEAFAALKKREADVKALFDRMPMGEFTPGVYLKNIGAGVQRLEISGKAAAGLKWTGFDIVMEHGTYRLGWFFGAGR